MAVLRSPVERDDGAYDWISAPGGGDLSDFVGPHAGRSSSVPAVEGIFVYGTLMPGEVRWPVLAPYAVGWARATAPGRLWDTGHGYPALRLGDGGPVPGVLVIVDPERLAEAVELLDEIEDEGRLYRRVEVTTSGGRAYAYEWLGPTDDFEPLAGGWPPVP